MWAGKLDAIRVLRWDLRRLRARMIGIGRDGFREHPDMTRLLLMLERAAFYTRQALAVAEGRPC